MFSEGAKDFRLCTFIYILWFPPTFGEEPDYLRTAGVEAIKLDATPAGQPVYEKLGFVGEGLIERWLRVKTVQETTAASSLTSETLNGICALDRIAFGADRSA